MDDNKDNLLIRKQLLENKLEEIKIYENGMLFSLLFKSKFQQEYNDICKLLK